MDALCLQSVEMHTAGEPLRIIHDGLPPIKGETILQKWNYIIEHLDHIRKLVILEPRGHRAMYGALLLKPDVPEAHLACIFMHNKYYGSMCGHGVIALGRYAVDRGMVKNPTSPETRLIIQCPCGPVETFVEYNNGKTGRVRFLSVPAFAFDLDVKLDIPGYGQVKVDISFGGAFYVIVPAQRLGLDVNTSPEYELANAAVLVTAAAEKARTLNHPDGAELAFISGTILTDGNDSDGSSTSSNMVVLGDKNVDRSPCGSGVTSRVALQYARGLIQLDEQRIFKGPSGATFTARPVKQKAYGRYDNAVVIEISGRAFFTGTSSFTLEDDDVIGRGFLLK